MAGGDYRSCDVCGGKCFYDANLNYEQGENEWNAHRPPYREAGEEQYSTPELTAKYGMKLDYVGDWAVICHECAQSHATQVVPRVTDAAKPEVG